MRSSGTGWLVPELPRVLCGGLARPALSPETWRPLRGCRLRLPPLSPTPTSSVDQPWRAGSGHSWVTAMSEHRGPVAEDWQSLPGGYQPHEQVCPIAPTSLQAILPVRSPGRLHCGRRGWAGFTLPLCLRCVCSVAQWRPTLCDPHGLQPTRLLWPRDSPGQHTGVGCHFLLQGESSCPRD